MSAETDQRLVRAAADCGIHLDGQDAARLAGLVERVEAGVDPGWPAGGVDSGRSPPAARPGAAGPHPAGVPGPMPATEGDGSGWVWRSAAEAQRRSTTPPGARAGPLEGWRLAVKDIIAVAGRPLRCGSAATFDAGPEPADAPVVADLRAAGARLVGTTRLHEFAFGTIGLDRAFGMPANPVDPDRIPGGSSAGAAVVVARGEADLSLGTDTGGSVRIPAALCGVVGFKPSYGALSTVGVVPLAPSLDHVGLLVASADRLLAPAGVLGLAGSDGAGPGPADRRGAPRRFAVAAGAAERCAPEVAAAFSRAVDGIASAGLDVVEVDWPVGEDVFAATTALMYAEAAHGHRRRLARRAAQYGSDVRDRLLQGLALGATTYLAARDRQREISRRCRDTFANVDAVLTPTVPVVAPRRADIADPAVAARLVTFTRLADLTGLPAVSLPLPPEGRAGGAGHGLAVGLQIEGPTDAGVLSAAVTLAELVGRAAGVPPRPGGAGPQRRRGNS